jgi:imidazole glycerol phosphate synthase glutamine amidotransferase subunit
VIVVVDYGAGNIRSVAKALEAVGADVMVTSSAKDVDEAERVVLPGVGEFGHAANALFELGVSDALKKAVSDGKPFLGICVGFQLMFDSSEESPTAKGLSIFSGKVRRFGPGLKVPHLGWNQVHAERESPLWKDIPDDEWFYFAHSFYPDPEDPALVRGRTDYGVRFASAVQKENVFGIQFHPEKSQKAGLKVLENFIKLEFEC